MNDVSFLAVTVAALSAFLLGGLWYSPLLFLKPWLADNDAAAESAGGHSPRVFITSFVFAVVAAIGFGWLLGPEPGLGDALLLGIVVGFLYVATSFGINYQFSNRPFRLWLIDGGYHVAQFLIYGVVFGLLG